MREMASYIQLRLTLRHLYQGFKWSSLYKIAKKVKITIRTEQKCVDLADRNLWNLI